MLRDGRLSAGHGRALAGVADAGKARRLAEETLQLGHSVRTLEERVKHLDAEKPKKTPKKAPPAVLTTLEDELRECFGTKVRVQGTEKKGKITIEYYSKEDLQRIYEQISN